MKNILTKSLTSLAFVGMVAVPLIASSAYGTGNTPANSQKKEHLMTNHDVQLLAEATSQDTNLCKYEANRSATARIYIESCMKPETLNQIPEDVRTVTLSTIKKYATDPSQASRPGAPERLAPSCKKAYPILTNKSNLRPPKDWTFGYDEEYRKKNGLGEYSPNL